MRYIIFFIGTLLLSTSCWALQSGSGVQGIGCIPDQKIELASFRYIELHPNKYKKEGWYIKQIVKLTDKGTDTRLYLLLERPCK